MSRTWIEVLGTAAFACAILHTFAARAIHHAARRLNHRPLLSRALLTLSEVEIVFGFWALVAFGLAGLLGGFDPVATYLHSRDWAEPVFVAVIMIVSSTRPILHAASASIELISRRLPLPPQIAFFAVTLVIGPLLGSLITEPAAMTVTANVILRHYFQSHFSREARYAIIGLLFVNISIGGTLTHFAAPPVLMVASRWNWDTPYMLANFGWKGALACVLSTAFVLFRYRSEFAKLAARSRENSSRPHPRWIYIPQLAFLAVIAASSHAPLIFIPAFLFFLGFASATSCEQGKLKIREGALVGFFLAGLVALGGAQAWWLAPLLARASSVTLYFGGIALTAVVDNAALTYLGSLVPSLTNDARYALVAGSVVGGGLTVIANAPNPVGLEILNPAFGDDGISARRLFTAACGPTLIALIIFWLF